MVNIRERVSHLERIRSREKRAPIVTLTGYQLREVLCFPDVAGNRAERVPFKALGGILNDAERERLGKFACDIGSAASYTVENNMRGLVRFAESAGRADVAGVLSKLSGYVRLSVITRSDLESAATFAKLPLLARSSMSHLGRDLFPQTAKFLENGAVIAFMEVVRLYPDYVTAIKNESLHEKEIPRKVALALFQPTPDIMQASHEFVTFRLIQPAANGNESFGRKTAEINRYIESRMADTELEYAKLKLQQTLLREQSKGVLRAMALVPLVTPLLYLISNTYGVDNEEAQTLVKFIPALIGDLITSYAHLRPWLDGDTKLKKMVDWGKKLVTSQKWSTLGVLGAELVGSRWAEHVGDTSGELAGSFIYGGVPFAVGVMQSVTATRLVSKETGRSFFDAWKSTLVSNPAQAAVDLGAFLTYATAVGVLGVAKQFHHPGAIMLIEGVEEHALAAAFTYLGVNIVHRQIFEERLNQKIDKWREEKLLPYLQKRAEKGESAA